MRWCQYVVFWRVIRSYLMQGSLMPNMKTIGQVVLEIFQKTYFSPHFWHNFEVISQVNKRKYQKSVRTRNIIQTFSFQKIKSDFDFDHPFGRYGSFKNGTIGPILALFPKYRENQIFPEHAVFAERWRTWSYMILNKKKYTSMNYIFHKIGKTAKSGTFWHFFPNFGKPRFFFKNPASSVGAHYCPATSCQVSERSYDRFSSKTPDRRTDGQGSIYRTNLLCRWVQKTQKKAPTLRTRFFIHMPVFYNC